MERGNHRRLDLRSGRHGLGNAVADVFHFFQRPLADTNTSQGGDKREVLQRLTARLGAGAGQRRAGRLTGVPASTLPRTKVDLGCLRRRAGSGERRHLGDRNWRPQPDCATPDHHRSKGRRWHIRRGHPHGLSGSSRRRSVDRRHCSPVHNRRKTAYPGCSDHLGRGGRLVIRFAAWRYCAGDLYLPSLSERNRAPPASYLRQRHQPVSRLELVEQRLGEFRLFSGWSALRSGAYGSGSGTISNSALRRTITGQSASG